MLGRVLGDIFRSLATARKPPPNPLAEYFFDNPGRLMLKWHHYFEIYHRHFAQFRGRSPVVLEIGAYHGGSLQMWKKYFGPGARIIGIDVDPRCRQFEEEQIGILIGDQEDRGFLGRVKQALPHVDIVIDDGGHQMRQQIVSFEELYPHLQPNGIYLCEDLHTSYMHAANAGYRRQGTFVEYSKGLVDCLHAWHSQEPGVFAVDAMTRSTHALHFYAGILVVEKRPMDASRETKTGRPSF
jgi:SAM-dependent methyltransferase